MTADLFASPRTLRDYIMGNLSQTLFGSGSPIVLHGTKTAVLHSEDLVKICKESLTTLKD